MKKGHHFPSKAGFSASGGKLRAVRSYMQAVPKKPHPSPNTPLPPAPGPAKN